MMTKQILGLRRRAAAVLFGLAVAGLLAGCATTSGDSGRVAGSAASASVADRDFYADWYDSTAVVLPPPPANLSRR